MAEAATAEKEAPTKKPRFTATLRFARIAPRKMRYVVDLIRGKDYNSAISILRVCPKRGAMFCKKLLESAFGNAAHLAQEQRLDLDGNALHVVEVRVDPGPTMKRWRASSVRRPTQILKRLCHVFVALEEREVRESRRDRARRQRQERQRQTQQAKKAVEEQAKGAAPPAAEAGAKPPAAGKKEKKPPKGEKKKDSGKGKSLDPARDKSLDQARDKKGKEEEK